MALARLASHPVVTEGRTAHGRHLGTQCLWLSKYLDPGGLLGGPLWAVKVMTTVMTLIMTVVGGTALPTRLHLGPSGQTEDQCQTSGPEAQR